MEKNGYVPPDGRLSVLALGVNVRQVRPDTNLRLPSEENGSS